MYVAFDVASVLSELDFGTFQRGLAVWQRDLVRHVEVSPDGLKISASVKGSARQPYSQTIAVKLRGNAASLNGYCTCPIGLNCKHVAAVLIDVAMADPNSDIDELIEDVDADGPDADDARPALPSQRVPTALVPRPPVAPPAPHLAMSREVTGWLERLTASVATAAPGQAGPPTRGAAANSASHRHLHYLLDDRLTGAQVPAGSSVLVRPMTFRQLKDGRIADVKWYNPDNVNRTVDQRAKFVTEADLLILRDLAWLMQEQSHYYGGETDIALGSDVTSRRALAAMIETGRLHFRDLFSPALTAGPELQVEPRWVTDGRGLQRLQLVPSGASDEDAAPVISALLPFQRLHYVDAVRGLVGPIVTDLPPALAVELTRAPAVAPAEAMVIREVLKRRLPQKRPVQVLGTGDEDPTSAEPVPLLPLPDAPDDADVRVVKPVPRLELALAEVKLKRQFVWYVNEPRYRGAFPLPVARLSFSYEGEIVDNADTVPSLQRVEDGRLMLLPRDLAAEVRAAEELSKLGFKALAKLPVETTANARGELFLNPPGEPSIYDWLAKFEAPARFIDFAVEAVPRLVSKGWEVVTSDDYPYRLAEGEAQWWADTGEGSGIDWFSFELGIEYDGHRINLVPQLARMLADLPADVTAIALAPENNDKFVKACAKLRMFHTLPDGRLLPLPGERMAPMLKAMMELIGPRGERLEGGKIKLHRAEAIALANFAGEVGLDVAWAASAERLIELGASLQRGRSLATIEPPKSFKAQLRGYQGDGLAWLDFLRDSGFGGVLADDMGLGKTVQALAYLAREKEDGRLDKPALIVAPTSVLPNWQAEAERFAPGLRVLALRGLERKQWFGDIGKHDLVLTTYPLLARDYEVLLTQEFHAAILDEAQAIKNPKATITKLAHNIKARHRLALTGTPLENNLGEVWSLFEFLSPGLLGDETTFRRVFRTPIEKHGSVAAQAFLSRRLKPFMLRRTKLEVAKELPPKTEMIERVRLEGPQRDLYETVRSLMHEKVREEIAKKGIAKSHIVFLDALLKLRQVCCDPRLIKMPQARKVKSSAKLERLMEMVPELVGEGRRILLFSQFTSMLDLIRTEIDKLKIPFVMLTGDTVDRATPVKQFQSGKVPIFLLSLKAGGTGLNLTAADTVIHYDPWWNPAVENQATDRAYRIGQDKPVFVYKLIVEEGIEEAIELLKQRKAALAEALFAGSSQKPLDLTEADINALFQPLRHSTPARQAA